MNELRIEPWSAEDRPLLDRLLGDPEMTTHLGGPESPEKLEGRQRRYDAEGSGQFRIVAPNGEAAGYVGYWERRWQDEDVWEVGWAVVPQFQGRGYATAAMRLLLDRILKEAAKRPVHAFPSVENAASNAVCRKLGFAFVGVVDFEYPPGHPLRCNDWRVDLDSRTDVLR